MKEDIKEKRERTRKIVKILLKEYPEAKIKLVFKNPFQLLVSTILSAQCTDDRVNIVTKELYKKYKTPKDFAECDIADLEKMIYSTGFYKAKAKNLQKCAKSLIEKFGGKVPGTPEELTQLEGVGRKTANVVLLNAFNIPTIPVDTHVHRLSNLLELSLEKIPDKVEFELMECVDKKDLPFFADLIMAHGRKICIANRPKCLDCKISDYCPSRKI
jgi:endonuclease III